MPLTIPLAVRLKTLKTDKHVTRDLRDLTFRSVAPGGFASATITLDRPLDLQPAEIDYYAEMYVYDRRNGEIVWEGRLEDPGRTAADGEIWQVTAVGPSAHAQDRTIPLIYVDQSISDGWTRADNFSPNVSVDVSADPGVANGATQAVVVTFDQGVAVVTNARGVWRYGRLIDSGQKLARVDYTWNCSGQTGWFVQAVTQNSGTTIRNESFTGGSGGSTPKVVVTNFTNGDNAVDLRAIYTGTVVTPTAVVWGAIRNVFIVAMRKDQSGADITTGYSSSSVLASQVVADLLGRLLSKYDGPNAAITATSFAIDSLAYPGGATAATILSDLMVLEPAYFWAAWESNSAGLHRFEWSPWPTTVRYEATVYDGFDSPGSAVDLYNAVRVRYLDEAGIVRTIQRTQTVTALTNAGLTREGLLDLTLSGGQMSLNTATQAGDQWLAQRAVPPNAGTLTVARRIRDLLSGTFVHPWEIRPGNLIRVRGVLPRIDALNPTARDGVTIFRISGVEFHASSASATCELDSYPDTVAHALAALGKFR